MSKARSPRGVESTTIGMRLLVVETLRSRPDGRAPSVIGTTCRAAVASARAGRAPRPIVRSMAAAPVGKGATAGKEQAFSFRSQPSRPQCKRKRASSFASKFSALWAWLVWSGALPCSAPEGSPLLAAR